MYRTELSICGRVSEISRTEGDKQIIRSLGIIYSKVLCMISVERSSAFPERVRMCSVVSSLMNYDIADAVLGIQYL